jgi:hypothetical protein
MPGLAVSLNGTHLVAVSTEGLNILTVRVHGDVIGPEFSSIDVYGGHYGDEKENKHLIWLDEREIGPGNEVEVEFLKETSTSNPGKTIEELYPDDEAQMRPWQSIEEIFKDLAKKLKVREQFAFRVVPPSGEAINSLTEANDHGFGFSVVWDWTRPDSAGVSLTSNSLESIENRQGGTAHARFRLQFGQSVKLRVDA